ncbi:anhydro-N-acetylmuramic acid kinase [Fulvivirga sp. 29W222]|uniref:Anhydro-N-acetylmuramic acid kinase n=1 Tax=Fulvivirga marina TaxID=2494733 RepID=A0A937FT25_9BACT|nr:anhydro-N-acetylmuramic acid kinase [Fulvivirga marina]MBL6445015.1 anhydro-N-acetylmuramic acid kinase [Fulvivirga marina]
MKNKEKYKVIGLMSGTSLDGLDMAYCEFELQAGVWHYKIKAAETRGYPEELYNGLQAGVKLSGYELTRLDVHLGRWFGEAVASFIDNHRLAVDFVASHGHTIFHQPELGITKQIGNGNIIAAISQLPVVSDFRTLDVALGGQGAPLVPIGDALLFHEYDFCLNLGGIANISFDNQGKRLAYDICPCNMVLNYVASKEGCSYDEGGAIAREGTVIPELLTVLNNLDFYNQPYPKSLGYEWVKDNVISKISNYDISSFDLMRTLVEHITNQISRAITGAGKSQRLLVTGGGAFNKFLIQRIEQSLKSEAEVCVPDDTTVNYKEALIFGFLGVLRSCGEVNTLSSVTGASRDSCTGGIVNPFLH